MVIRRGTALCCHRHHHYWYIPHADSVLFGRTTYTCISFSIKNVVTHNNDFPFLIFCHQPIFLLFFVNSLFIIIEYQLTRSKLHITLYHKRSRHISDQEFVYSSSKSAKRTNGAQNTQRTAKKFESRFVRHRLLKQLENSKQKTVYLLRDRFILLSES